MNRRGWEATAHGVTRIGHDLVTKPRPPPTWLHPPSTVILEKKIKSSIVSSFSSSVCHEVLGPDAMILVSWMLSFKLAFSFSSFTLIKSLFSSTSIYAIRVVSYACLKVLIFLPAIWFQLVFIHPGIFMMYCAYNLNNQGDNMQPNVPISQFWTCLLFLVHF